MNEFQKHKITARKHGGNDASSWAVFIKGKVFANGLTLREVNYYRQIALNQCIRKQNEIPNR